MKDTLYLSRVTKVLKKSKATSEEIEELINETVSILEQFDNSEYVKKLGLPEMYAKELLELNEIDDIEVKKSNYRLIAGIYRICFMFVGIVIAIIGIIYVFNFNNTLLQIPSIIILLISLLSLLVYKIYYKKLDFFTIVLSFSVLVALFYSGVNSNVEALNIIAALSLITYGGTIFYIFVQNFNIMDYIVDEREATSITVVGDTMYVESHFTNNSATITNDIKIVYVDLSYGNISIDASSLTHDLIINVDAKIGEINIDLPLKCNVIDNTSVSFGESNNIHHNIEGINIKINGNIKFGSINY